MTRDQKMLAAMADVTFPNPDLHGAFREHIAPTQVDPEDFRRWLLVLREIPEGLLPKMVDTMGMAWTEAFHKCLPDFVSVDEFVAWANGQQAKAEAEAPTTDTESTDAE